MSPGWLPASDRSGGVGGDWTHGELIDHFSRDKKQSSEVEKNRDSIL